MKQIEIAFIGAGNMATNLIGGLLKQGLPASNLRAADPALESRRRLQASTGIVSSRSNRRIIAGADVVILAVKPQVMAGVCSKIHAAVIEQKPLVISIAAGITIASLEKALGESTTLVRCMPNAPALLQAGATALFANSQAHAWHRTLAEQILGALGTTCWVKQEAELDAVTALSGSGPAYFFLFMEAMCEAGVKLGLDRETSRELVLQTGLGACRMAAEGDVDLPELWARVASPGGTTECALRSFEDNGLRGIIETAMQSAHDRAREMSRELD